jgi:hypothetical protein
MGGYFALAFAPAHPERVEKTILIGAPPMMSEHLDAGHRILGTRGLNRWIYPLRATKESLGSINRPLGFLYAHPERLRSEEIEVQRAAEALPGAGESWLTMVEEVTGGKVHFVVQPEGRDLYRAHADVKNPKILNMRASLVGNQLWVAHSGTSPQPRSQYIALRRNTAAHSNRGSIASAVESGHHRQAPESFPSTVTTRGAGVLSFSSSSSENATSVPAEDRERGRGGLSR